MVSAARDCLIAPAGRKEPARDRNRNVGPARVAHPTKSNLEVRMYGDQFKRPNHDGREWSSPLAKVIAEREAEVRNALRDGLHRSAAVLRTLKKHLNTPLTLETLRAARHLLQEAEQRLHRAEGVMRLDLGWDQPAAY
jgi:hypothetical protein